MSGARRLGECRRVGWVVRRCVEGGVCEIVTLLGCVGGLSCAGLRRACVGTAADWGCVGTVVGKKGVWSRAGAEKFAEREHVSARDAARTSRQSACTHLPDDDGGLQL